VKSSVSLAIEENIPLVEEILGSRKETLRDGYLGYRNHVYRMIHFCFAQGEFDEEQRQKITIAGCFHDLGIWSGDTFDYIPPSLRLASNYLSECGREAWIPGIGLMIDQHHKLRRYKTDPLTEVFRRGDLVDLSLGIVKCGIPGAYVKDVRSSFPNAGFHRFLVRLAGGWICRHPLDPVPVLKW